MDTPESDVSAIQSGTMDLLPLYVEREGSQSAFRALLAKIASSTGEPNDRCILDDFVENKLNKAESLKPIDHYPMVPERQPDPLTRVKQTIVNELYYAIRREDGEAIALLIKNNLVTANTTSEGGRTPLLDAVATRNVRVVEELLGFGADPNAFGVVNFGYSTQATRTPLQLSASMGHLPLVKLFMEVYHCDDSVIAPDGQIALRLAAENGHREIVDYLPARRGGGFLRWQTQHQKAIRRVKKALTKIFKFFKFFLWDVEKFFVWTVPKHVIVKPLVKGCTWCWESRKKFLPWCKYQVQQAPIRIKRFGKWVWKGVKAVPKAAANTGKAAWKFGTKTLPKWLKKLALWLWNLFTKRIPNAIAIVAKWIWAGLLSTSKAVGNIILKTASLLHTIFEAVITFLRNLTLKDIWSGFCDLLRAVFITFPKTLWSWILAFSETSFKFMKLGFGTLGECIWWAIVGIGLLVLYVPRKLWEILQSLGGSVGKALSELIIWANPKA